MGCGICMVCSPDGRHAKLSVELELANLRSKPFFHSLTCCILMSVSLSCRARTNDKLNEDDCMRSVVAKPGGKPLVFELELELEPVAGSDCGLYNVIALAPPGCGCIDDSAVSVSASN